VSSKIAFYKNDLPADVTFHGSVAVDTETLGLKPHRDRLCLVQLSAGDGTAHLVQFDRDWSQFGKTWAAPRLTQLLADKSLLKIFHFARFDMAALARYLGQMPAPVYCTKIASKLARTYTDRHSLKDLCAELIGIDLSKQLQSSDWGAGELSDQQKQYAAADVLHLHALKAKLDAMLEREGRLAEAEACFAFLPIRAKLDLAGFEDMDLFAH
jgi:ribonuclease D